MVAFHVLSKAKPEDPMIGYKRIRRKARKNSAHAPGQSRSCTVPVEVHFYPRSSCAKDDDTYEKCFPVIPSTCLLSARNSPVCAPSIGVLKNSHAKGARRSPRMRFLKHEIWHRHRQPTTVPYWHTLCRTPYRTDAPPTVLRTAR